MRPVTRRLHRFWRIKAIGCADATLRSWQWTIVPARRITLIGHQVKALSIYGVLSLFRQLLELYAIIPTLITSCVTPTGCLASTAVWTF